MSTNPEAKYPHLLLTKPSDEYLLNLCKSTTWFVVELCEAIQVKKVCKIIVSKNYNIIIIGFCINYNIILFLRSS